MRQPLLHQNVQWHGWLSSIQLLLLLLLLLAGLPRLNELWPSTCLDASAFAASEPAELALALRALSDQGPPRRY
jgi:hypothetical protein